MALDGDYAAAADLFRRALGLRPDDAMSRNNLGLCLLEMGEREAGEASLRAAAHGAPQMAGLALTSLATSRMDVFSCDQAQPRNSCGLKNLRC
jgi:Flp pilus assembly protein TadD